MQTTGNLGLKKPEGTDIVNIEDLNGNMDILDGEVVKLASTTEAGRMSAADKAKLNGIAAGAQANAVTSIAGKTGAVALAAADIASGTLAAARLPAATTAAQGALSAADKTKLDGATSAGTANTLMSRDASGRSQVAAPAAAADVANKGYVDSAVSSSTIPDASTTVKGKVQLSTAINSTSTTLAATASAAKAAYDRGSAGVTAAAAAQSRADEAFTLGVEQKSNVVAALNSIGVAAATSEAWASLIGKIGAIIRATGNAVPGDVRAGKTYSDATGNNRTGTLPVRSTTAITPTENAQNFPAGIYPNFSVDAVGLPPVIFLGDYLNMVIPANSSMTVPKGTMRRLDSCLFIDNFVQSKRYLVARRDGTTVQIQRSNNDLADNFNFAASATDLVVMSGYSTAMSIAAYYHRSGI